MADLDRLSTSSCAGRRDDRDPGNGSRWHRRRLRLASAAVAAALLAGCNTTNEDLINNGIGASLYTADLARETDLLEQYAGHICVQASLPTVPGSGSPRCDYPSMTRAHWTDFLIQGMNDIDRRCDSYLLWLDARRRNSNALQSQISDTAAATAAIMGVSGATAKAISIVGVAFGLLRNTVENYTSRLLLEIDGSTVSTIVLTHRNSFRNDRTIYQAASKPEVLYVLRGYLRLCLPFAIEREINAFATQAVLGVSRPVAVSPLAAANVVTAPTVAASAPVTATQQVLRRQRVTEPGVAAERAEVEAMFANPTGKSIESVKLYQEALCVPPTGNVRDQTKSAITVFEDRLYQSDTTKFNGKLDDDELDDLLGTGSTCNQSLYANVDEKTHFGDNVTGKRRRETFIEHMNAIVPANALPRDTDVSTQEGMNAFREKVRSLRDHFSSELSQAYDVVKADSVFKKLRDLISDRALNPRN